jgi:transposase
MNGRETSQLTALKEELAQLRTAHAELQATYAGLQAAHAELQAAFAEREARNAELSQRALAAEELVRTLKAERDQQAEVLAAMKGELEELKRRVFGKRSEKMPPVSRELKKQDGDAPTEAEAAAAAEQRKKNREARKNLPTRRVEHKVKKDDLQCPKCGTHGDEFKAVGDGVVTEEWEFVPGHFERRVHVQETLACPCGEHIVTAPGPHRVIDGGMYGPGFIADVLVAKGMDSIPLYRMEKQFERLGIPVARATLVGLFHKAIEQCLKPIADRILEIIRQSPVVLADETTMGMQRKPDTDKAGKGYVWTFIAKNLVAYVFSATRSGETPRRILGGTEGTLLVDAYSAYSKVCGPDSRERAGCLAHVRRKFFDALATAPQAQQALDLILQVYRVEHDAKEQGIVRTPAHLKLRKTRSAAIMHQFHAWLLLQRGQHLPKGPMGKAISYALDNWGPLTCFLKSEQTPVDNNASERALRVVALGRKNYLFTRDEETGGNHAALYTVLATCEANGVNPLHYLTDILPRVKDHPDSRIDELLPQNWKPPEKPPDTA